MIERFDAHSADAQQSDATAAARKTYHHGNLREQLIVAVRELVETKGPDGFSIAEASRVAGVSSAAPYKHFKDKEAVLHALVIDGMSRLGETMLAAIAPLPVGSLERINALGQCYIDFARIQPGVFRLMFGLTRGHESEQEIVEKGRACFQIVITCVAECLGIAPDDQRAMERAYSLWCFVHGHSFLVIDDKSNKADFQIDEPSILAAVSRALVRPL